MMMAVPPIPAEPIMVMMSPMVSNAVSPVMPIIDASRITSWPVLDAGDLGLPTIVDADHAIRVDADPIRPRADLVVEAKIDAAHINRPRRGAGT